MAQVSVTQCDITGTISANVKRYRFKIDEVTGRGTEDFAQVKCVYLDLSPAGFKRAMNFIDRGLLPTKGQLKKFGEDEPECFNAPNEHHGTPDEITAATGGIDSGITTGQEVKAPTG